MKTRDDDRVRVTLTEAVQKEFTTYASKYKNPAQAAKASKLFTPQQLGTYRRGEAKLIPISHYLHACRRNDDSPKAEAVTAVIGKISDVKMDDLVEAYAIGYGCYGKKRRGKGKETEGIIWQRIANSIVEKLPKSNYGKVRNALYKKGFISFEMVLCMAEGMRRTGHTDYTTLFEHEEEKVTYQDIVKRMGLADHINFSNFCVAEEPEAQPISNAELEELMIILREEGDDQRTDTVMFPRDPRAMAIETEWGDELFGPKHDDPLSEAFEFIRDDY